MLSLIDLGSLARELEREVAAEKEASSPVERPRVDQLREAWSRLGLEGLLDLLTRHVSDGWRIQGTRLEGPCPGQRGKCVGDPFAAYVYLNERGPWINCGHRESCKFTQQVFDVLAHRFPSRSEATKAILDFAQIESSTVRPWKGSAGPVVESEAPTSTQEPKRARRKPRIVRMDSVARVAVEFLWKPYLPLGKLTLLEGDPGCGKTWIALSVAAIVSRGLTFSVADGVKDDAPHYPENVIYLTAEDGLADTLGPRLDAVGADSSHVHVIEGWDLENPDGSSSPGGSISLKDVDVLDEAMDLLRPALVIVDPIQAYLGAEVDMHRANEVRPVLTGLVQLAEKHRASVVAIRHLSKAPSTRALYRGMGSIDFAAAARSVLMAGEDPKTKNRALVHLKSSLGAAGRAVGYGFGPQGFEWTGPSDLTAANLNAADLEDGEDGGEAIVEAVEFLRFVLKNGPKKSTEVQNEARKNSISATTLRRAKKKLRIVSEPSARRGNDGGHGMECWTWSLPRELSPAPSE